ncbi:MAG: protein kinase [Hungatella sp.]|nr:protein kinase [Hungatella sp.]
MLRTGIYLQGRYEILGLIGSGGMADVYKAKCHKLNRLVAIKVLKEEFSDDSGFLGKFQMEAQAAAGLSHPNIVNVYDVVDEGNIHCIVMELIEGITLKSYILKKGKLEVKEAVGIAIQVAQGIAAAHEQKIIHRDIKPQNMIISRDGKVKVADFGIARAATTQTMTSEAMGSVHYISPEQARGGYSDARSDIYSLGITMYEMVTGRLPFEGENTVAIAIAQLQEPITRPSFYNPEIPVSLEGIILKCTEKKPERRYSQILEVIADLRRMLVHPDDDFVQPVPEVDMGAGTVVIGKEELEEIKRGIDSAREWDSLGSRDSMAVRDGIRDWEISGSRDNMISRDNSRDWDNTNGRDSMTYRDNGRANTGGNMAYRDNSRNWDNSGVKDSMTYRDNSQDWEISDDGDDVLTRDSRDWDNTGGRDYVRGRDNAGERNNRREWAWEEEEWERNQDRDHHNSRDNDVAPKFEKLLTSLGVLMAILIVAILVVVFSRIGGLLNFSSDDESSDIQTEIISSEESTSSMEVEVPNVLELPVDMAEDRLKESTLVMKVSGYANSDTVDKDCIISQEFPEGTVIQKYSTVTVVVSNGSDLVKLSELTLEGMTEETAKVLLEQKKLIVKEEQEYHDTIKEGQVIRYEPSQARPGETVTLYISAGPITVMKTVPDIRQKTEEEAISNLLQAGLNPGQVSQEYHDTIPQGYVISQGVEPNLLIKEGSTVSYIVSKGTEPKRYITTINENYNLGRAVGPGMLAADVTVEVRLKQTVNGETIYTTLMSPTTFAGTDIISLSFHDVEGAPGVETGEVEVFDVDSGQILASFPVKFTAVVEG